MGAGCGSPPGTMGMAPLLPLWMVVPVVVLGLGPTGSSMMIPASSPVGMVCRWGSPPPPPVEVVALFVRQRFWMQNVCHFLRI